MSQAPSAKACLTDGERPPTPPGVRKHHAAGPGEQAGHWGTAELAARAGGMTHGVVGATADPLLSTAAALRIAPQSETAAWREAQAEANYARNKVPLGAPVPRGFALPADGRPAGGSASLAAGPRGETGGASAALRPAGAAAEATGPAYREPGFQGSRAPDADWEKRALPRDAVFGAPPLGAAAETAADALAGDRSGAPDAPPRKAPPPSAAAAVAASGAAFGLPPRGAAESITDALKMSPEALAAAAARDAEAARRATVPAPGRNAGVPTFRTDVPAPAVRSVADTRAFGDDPPIGSLIAPTAHAAAAAAPPMAADELAGLLAAAGVPLPSEALFREIFAAAAAADALPGGATARLATFQKLRIARGL